MTGDRRHDGRRRVGWMLALAALVAIIAGCIGAAPTPPSDPFTPAPRDTASSAASASLALPDSPVAGAILSVQNASPGPPASQSPHAGSSPHASRIPEPSASEVIGFVLAAQNGDQLTFVLGKLDDGSDVLATDLASYQASAAPVLVYFRVQDGKLVVYRIKDAG